MWFLNELYIQNLKKHIYLAKLLFIIFILALGIIGTLSKD